MFYLPGQPVTPERLSHINRVDESTARQDIAETAREIQRYHRLTLSSQVDGSYRIEGAVIDQRLCLLHGLRRALRLCPHFIAHHFTPALKTQLKLQGIARTLYDDTNLQALVNRCSRMLNRQFDCRDVHFLRLYLQYCLLQHHLGLTRILPMSSSAGRNKRWSSLSPRRSFATGNAGSPARARGRTAVPDAALYVVENARSHPRRPSPGSAATRQSTA